MECACMQSSTVYPAGVLVSNKCQVLGVVVRYSCAANIANPVSLLSTRPISFLILWLETVDGLCCGSSIIHTQLTQNTQCQEKAMLLVHMLCCEILFAYISHWTIGIRIVLYSVSSSSQQNTDHSTKSSSLKRLYIVSVGLTTNKTSVHSAVVLYRV